jgi:hypothetical protein
MNSNRKKYASTPTYGMQKRNFAKKQASAQPTPTPDFTQHSADAGVPVTPFPLQNPLCRTPTRARPRSLPRPRITPTRPPSRRAWRRAQVQTRSCPRP